MPINSINEFKMNYTKIFHQKVLPELQKFEEERKRTYAIALSLSISVFSIIAISLYFFMGMGQLLENFLYGLVFIAAFGGFPAYKVYRAFQKKFESKLKTTIMPILMPAFGDFKWMQLSPIRDGEIKMSKLYTQFDKMNADDNFIGSYKDIPIRITETELTFETTDSDGHRETMTEFKGVLIGLGIPKHFTGYTIIKPKTVGGPYKEVKLEDVDFSKKFTVRSTDQVEARYLLTPAFMERYKNIQKAFGGESISASFLDNKLLIAISVHKDLFSLGALNKPMGDTKQFTVFLNEIVSVFEMIEELKLYQNIGM